MDKEITKESATEILIKCAVAGQSKGAYSIKDASFLYKVVTEVRSKDGKTKENYDALVRAVVVANGKGTFGLEEAALIERVVDFLDKENMLTSDKPQDTKEV